LAALAVLLMATLFPGVGAAQGKPPAQGLPAVNLGFTSFLDGGPPAGPGVYFQTYLQYFWSNELKDYNGDESRLGGELLLDSLNVLVSLNQLIYQSDQSILPGGGKWGIDVIVPLVYLDSDPNPAAPVQLRDNGVGFGDLLIGPYIQWDPIMGKKGPVFMHRIELQNLLPTGKYDDDRVLNPGANFYSFNPYWAATLFISPRWKTSWRVHYLWNAKNKDPNKTLFTDRATGLADDTQAGQAIHLNFSSAFELLLKQLHVGVNGYYLKQITDSETDGEKRKGQREQVLGIGPGAVWHFSPDNHVFFNTYFETQAENRPEGKFRFNLRWTHHF
jgi:anthranilate 1,2-dioxygenase (deaminating, decarboxylating) large subunit